MSEQEFDALRASLCLALGTINNSHLPGECLLDLDGVHIGLFFDPTTDTDKLQCYVDLGSFDPIDRPKVHEELLKLNLFTGSKTRGVFAIDPTTGNALMVSHLSTGPKVNGEYLAKVMRSYAAMVEQLRKGLI